MPFVACLARASSPKKVEHAVDGCAQQAGLDAPALHACADGVLGDELEAAAERATAALRPPHRWVPWTTVRGVALGPLDATLFSLRTVVCAAFTGRRPPACFEDPPDADAVLAAAAPHVTLRDA